MMKSIIFNTGMVQSILDNAKGVTRRLVKLPSYITMQENGLYTLFADGDCYENQHFEDVAPYIDKPYREGDILYVRETWCQIKDIPNWIEYYRLHGGPTITPEEYVYKADNVNNRSNGILPRIKWKPSIHMPKEAARIFLKVKSVRLQRLQDMQLDDFLASGVVLNPEAFNDPDNAYLQARDQFMRFWNSTVKKDRINVDGWDANPWVWVIEFDRERIVFDEFLYHQLPNFPFR